MCKLSSLLVIYLAGPLGARTLFESMQVQTIVASLGGNFKPLTKDDFKNLMLGPAVVVEGRQH